jgi:hypothetical protein
MVSLEKDLTKVAGARAELEKEIVLIQQKLEMSQGCQPTTAAATLVPPQTTTNSSRKLATNKPFITSSESTTTSRIVRPMTVDEEVASLVRRSKMAVLRAAMVGQGEAAEAIESVDFDRYAIQLVMLLRKLRKFLMAQSGKSMALKGAHSTAFRWRWEDLELDLRTASREEQRALQKQQEAREKQRLRRAALQEHYQDGSAGDSSNNNAAQTPAGAAANRDSTSVIVGGSRPNVSGPTLLRSLRSHTGLKLTEHEQALVLTHFEYNAVSVSGGGNSTGMRVDVEEFMDAMRPPLNFRRQRIVDAMFTRFRESEKGLRIQEWRNEANMNGARAAQNTQTELVSGTEVWAAYCAFRTLTPSGHRRGHVALEALDLWLRPVPEKQARKWLEQETRAKRSGGTRSRSGSGSGSASISMLPAVARQPLRREQWDALHRALGARIPDDAIFERCVRAAWVFAGEASLSVVGGRASGSDGDYDGLSDAAEGPFGVSLDAVNAFVTEVPPIVDAAGKAWVKFGDRASSGGALATATEDTSAADDDERMYWYCRATGERTWKEPVSVAAAARSAELSAALSRKSSALSDLESVEAQLRKDVERWCQKVQRQGQGLSGDDDDIASSGCLSLRGLSVTHIPDIYLGEGGTLAPGLEGTVSVGGGGKGSATSSPITHLWLDGNPFGMTEAGMFEGLSTIMSRAAPTAEEISLCNCNIGNGEGSAGSARQINDALFAAEGVLFKR